MAHVAFLGTGLLGSGMVECMIGRGHTVTVWNRTESKARRLESLGAIVAPTPERAVASAERVHMTLPDDAVVEEIVQRIATALPQGAAVMDHSTTLPAATKARLPRLQRQGIRYLHAPVFMSPQMCRDAAGMMLVSGAQRDYDAVKDGLAQMTGHVWYMGERPDLAAAYKLFGNSMIFVLAGGLSDVFALARGAGVDPRDAIALFDRFPVGNMIATRGKTMAARQFHGELRADHGAQGHAADAGDRGRSAAGRIAGPGSAHGRGDRRRHGKDDLGVIAAEIVREA